MDPFSPLLTPEQARAVRAEFGTPAYVYSEAALKKQAEAVLAFPAPFGLTARFAMKACPNRNILRLFADLGLHFDASSGFEARRAIAAGIVAERISLSSQELPADFAELLQAGVRFNACSLHQLETYGKQFPNSEVGVRFNPGMGSGHNNRTNVGGPASSFGIWHEKLPEVLELCQKHGLKIMRVHTHIGSGADPEVWARVVQINLDLVRQLPDVRVLNMGGGFKVARMPGEKTTDLRAVGARAKEALEAFAAETGRKLHLEIEPGTYLVATTGSVLATVQDVADTGKDGYHYLKLDSGMTEILRPSLYGAQHGIHVFPAEDTGRSGDYLVVGHCCESGDILTPAPGDPEGLTPRKLPETKIGDLLEITGAGAYCAAMPALNYNSFPAAPEVLLLESGELRLIRRRQKLEEIYACEL